MINYGLKLWSTNIHLFNESVSLVKKGHFDFIELYIVPEAFDKNKFKIFKEYNIKISFHLPHNTHGFNPIDKNNNSEKIWDILKNYIDYLNPFAMILHPETEGNFEILKQRLNYFNDKRILVENMPYKSYVYNNYKFWGYSIEQLKQVIELGYKICFDFAKAKSAANSRKINIIDYWYKMIDHLNPNYFHISGFLANTECDEHFDLREGDKKLIKKMKNVLDNIGINKDIYIVFECRKKNGIKNDLKNLEHFKHL